MKMQYKYSRFIRIGLLLIGIAGFVFALGDAFIPQDDTMFEPTKDPQAFGNLVTSDGFKFWALRGLIGIPLELIGSIALWLALIQTPGEKLAFWAMILCVVMDLFGMAFFSFAAFMFPEIGEMILSGSESVAELATLPNFIPVFMGGMLITFIGLLLFAIAIWKSEFLPKWSGYLVFAGFLMLMISSYAVQIIANLLWGIGYLWMAASVWNKLSPHSNSGTSA